MEITHTRHLEGRDQLGKLCSLEARNVAWESSNLVLEVGLGSIAFYSVAIFCKKFYPSISDPLLY